jgi:CBS domain containing-hemolysin-like protein
MMPPGAEIALLCLLLAASAFFSSSETAVFSLRPHELRKLEKHPSPRSLAVVRLLGDPNRFLVAVLVGNTLANVAASSLGTRLVSRHLETNAVVASVALMTVLILVVGEVVPKTYALNNPVKVSVTFSRLLAIVLAVLGPLKRPMEAFLALAVRPKLVRSDAAGAPSGEHVAEAVSLGRSRGVVDTFDSEVLQGLFKLMHLSVQNIMTPRTEVFMLDSNLTLAGAITAIKASGFSRVPLFSSGSRDDIVGVLYVKDVLYGHYGGDVGLGQIARKPVFVPETKPVVDLMREFAGGAAHFAVVIDEYGCFTGIVTIDDILAEITLRGPSSQGAMHSYVKRSRSAWEVSGRMELQYLSALTGVPLADVGPQTVGGLVTQRLGKIPSRGEEVILAGLRFTVIEADARRVTKVLVARVRK